MFDVVPDGVRSVTIHRRRHRAVSLPVRGNVYFVKLDGDPRYAPRYVTYDDPHRGPIRQRIYADAGQ
jgi:hypothetical protein